MASILKKATNGYVHWCQGCKMRHFISTDTPNHLGAIWSFNGDLQAPTFNPSINIIGMCHYFITGGNINYCGDSKHALAGQTLPLQNIPSSEWDDDNEND